MMMRIYSFIRRYGNRRVIYSLVYFESPGDVLSFSAKFKVGRAKKKLFPLPFLEKCGQRRISGAAPRCKMKRNFLLKSVHFPCSKGALCMFR